MLTEGSHCKVPMFLNARCMYNSTLCEPAIDSKFPKVITHEKRVKEVDKELDHRIQIDRIAEMQKWAENINNVQEHMNLSIVAANNHYAGFGPGTVNIFRNMIGLPEAKWEEKDMEI